MSRQEIYHVHDPILLMAPISYHSLSESSFPGKINAHTQRNVNKSARRETLSLLLNVMLYLNTELVCWSGTGWFIKVMMVTFGKCFLKEGFVCLSAKEK